ncbi:MAG: thioesterase II family protein [Tumebacillaceae bacterium]
MQVVKEIKHSIEGKNLICFPHSGAFSTAFRPISQFVSADWGVIAIDPPGHGTNRTKLLEDIQQMVDLYEQALEPRFSTPFVLFGHSLGGLVVYLLAQRLEKRGIRPDAVIISACKPPHLPRKQVTHFNEQEFLEYIISLGGISRELAQHQELLDLFMPVIRADFKSIETFDHTDHTLLESPVYVFSADEDHAATHEDSQGWTKWAKHVEFHTFTGGHMFLMSEAEAVARKVQMILNHRVLF